MRTTLLLLLALLTPSCGAVLGVGAGVAISQNYIEGKYHVAIVNRDADIVWATVKSYLSHESQQLIETDEDHRVAAASIDDSKVTVGVEVYDLNRAQLKVAAKKYGVSNGDMAELVMNQIVLELEDEE